VGSAWVASGATSQQPVGAASVCKADSPGCVYPEKAFLNSAELRQEVSLAALGPGEFYINYTTDQLYLYDDPTGKTVEVTTGSGGIVGFAGGENVTVKNLVFEKFGGGAVSGSGNNALKAVNGWRVENNEFRFIARVAVVNFGNGVVRNNYIHHNGQYGIMGGSRFEGNIIAFNNTDGFDPNNDAGASKFLRTVGLVVRGNRAYNNNGRGFWTDFDNLNTTYENNIIESNTEMGIFHEASCAAWIRNNVVRGNNSVNQGKSLWHGAQVYMRSSKDVEIAGNDISAAGAAGNAVSVRADLTYTGTNCGSIQTRNISVHDNIIRLGAGDMHGVVGVSAGYGLANNIKFNYNTYYLPDPLAAYFWYDATTKALTKDQWRNTYGQDWNGTFH
jgi:hypothetical protein